MGFSGKLCEIPYDNCKPVDMSNCDCPNDFADSHGIKNPDYVTKVIPQCPVPIPTMGAGYKPDLVPKPAHILIFRHADRYYCDDPEVEEGDCRAHWDNDNDSSKDTNCVSNLGIVRSWRWGQWVSCYAKKNNLKISVIISQCGNSNTNGRPNTTASIMARSLIHNGHEGMCSMPFNKQNKNTISYALSDNKYDGTLAIIVWDHGAITHLLSILGNETHVTKQEGACYDTVFDLNVVEKSTKIWKTATIADDDACSTLCKDGKHMHECDGFTLEKQIKDIPYNKSKTIIDTLYNKTLKSLKSMSSNRYQLLLDEQWTGNITDNWKIITKDDPTHGCVDYGNHEDALYIRNKKLKIHPQRQDNTVGFRSGRIESLNSYNYGFYESKLKVPGKNKNSWPAFWLVSRNKPYGKWPLSGEIDIMESINSSGQVLSTMHCGTSDHNKSTGIGKSMGTYNFQNYNIFSVNFLPDRLDFYVNTTMYNNRIVNVDSEFNPTDTIATPKSSFSFADELKSCATEMGKNPPAPFDSTNNFKIILNYDVGGDWPGEAGDCKPNTGNNSCICKGYNPESYMSIEYVRFWKFI
jgi:hypothetical protein